jgi:hypothetical protein
MIFLHEYYKSFTELAAAACGGWKEDEEMGQQCNRVESEITLLNNYH